MEDWFCGFIYVHHRDTESESFKLISYYSAVFEDEEEGEEDLDDDIDDENESAEWSILNPSRMPKVKISLEPADGLLLSEARTEIRTVCARVREHLKIGTNSSVGISEVFNMCLEPILTQLFQLTDAGMTNSGSKVSGSDMAHFIRVLATLSLYKATPTKFWDPFNRELVSIGRYIGQGPVPGGDDSAESLWSSK